MKSARVLIVLVVVLLVSAIVFMIYSVYARLEGSEYRFQVDAVLTAASLANEEDPLTTDPQKAVIAEYEGRRTVVVPDNYMALSSYLRKDAASKLFFSMDRENTLTLTVCNEAVFRIAPQDESGDVVLVELTTMGRRFRIRTDGGNQWTSLLACCMKGTYHSENIPLE